MKKKNSSSLYSSIVSVSIAGMLYHLSKNVSGLKKTALYLLSLDEPEKIKLFIEAYGKSLVNKKDTFFLQDKKNEFISKFKPKKYPSLFLYAANKEFDTV